MSESPQLLCVGNLTLDEAISPTGERTDAVGGDALFAALAARLVGGAPRLLAPLGVDAPDALLRAVRTSGTDPALLPRRDLPNVRNVIRYQADGGRIWDLLLGEQHFEAMSVQPSDVTDDLLQASGVLLSAMAIGAQLELAAWLRPRTAATIFFDPQEDYIAGHQEQLVDAVRACDVFLPSEVEAVALSGLSEPSSAARAFLDLGPDVVVVKLAAAGCLVATRERPEPVHIRPPSVVAPVDSTGAGDAFCGAFAVEHLRSGDVEAAVDAGIGAAAVALGGSGINGLLDALAASAGPIDRPVVRR